jgi:hypothetical protein
MILDADMTYEKQEHILITDPQDKLLYREIMLFSLQSLKRRVGFDSSDCKVYLVTKGVSTDVSVVEQALKIFATAGILDESYSSERKKTIYRLH